MAQNPVHSLKNRLVMLCAVPFYALLASASAQTPSAPANFSATPTNGQVSLKWSAVSATTSYNLKRATVNGGPYATLANLTATNYTDAIVVSGTACYYVVTAVNASGESTNSLQATAMPSGSVVWSPLWQTQDIGMVGLAGSASYTNGVFTVTGAGTDIQGTADAFRFVSLSVSGDCTITARVPSLQNIDPWSKAGVMIRESLATNSANAFVGITPGNGVTWQYRSTTGGGTSYNKTTGLTAPYWVRMVRSGNTFTGYQSADGITWTQQGTATITMASTVYIGPAITSHTASSLCTATFDNVTVPPQWPTPMAPSAAAVTNQTVVAGNSTALNATISGYPVPVLQWCSNSVALVNQTNALLALNNVQYAQNGTVYSLVASNTVGGVTNYMTLTVLVTPAITGPANQAAPIGATVTISTTVTGVPTPVTRWWFGGNSLSDGATGNGSTISGSATGTLVINNAQAADTGTYSLVATNSAGMVTNSMTLIVSSTNVAPGIVGPTDQTVVQSNNATFTASVSGLPVPTLQWRVNGAPISGQTNSSLTVSNVQYSQNGYVYSVVASNVAGMATNSANLFVLMPTTISASPANLVVTNTQSATFTVTAGGVPSPNYQWFFNNSPMANATSASYTIPSATPANIGNYFVIVSNTVNSATSSVATLTVNSTMAAMALVPGNGATGVCYDTPFYITFSQTPFLRTAGTIKVYNANNPALPVDTIDLSLCVTNDPTYARNIQPYSIGGDTFNAFPVIITGTTAAIYPHHGVLTSGQTYFVALDDGTFTDGTGAYFAGISNSNTWRFTTKPTGPAGSTNLVVAGDYSGDFATVQGAVDFVSSGNTTPRVINIRDGTYTEIVDIKSRNNLDLRGQSRAGTVVGYPNNNNVNAGAPWRACFVVNGNNCALETLTLTNMTPKGGGQAEAVDVEGTRAIFFNINLASYQDTFLSHNSGELIYFQDSLVQGDTDFNWGYGSVYYTNCEIRCLSSGGHVTQPRSPLGNNGFAFVNCQVTKGFSSGNFDLGRTIGSPTSPSQVLFAESLMDDAVTGYSSDAGTNMCDYACSNLTATAAKTLTYSTHLTASSSWVIAAQSAPSWLYGWQPQLAPNIISQLTNQSASGGQPITLAVGATGIPGPAYQWKFNGAPLSGATNAALTFASVGVTNSGTYSVVVFNASGTMTSSNAVLSVANSAPVFTPVSDKFVNAGVTLNVTNIATDVDVPPQTLTFGLLANPLNSTLNAAGVFNWRPPASQGGTTNLVSVIVTDNGTPNLSATNNFKVIVNPVSRPSLGMVLYSGKQLSFTAASGTVGPDYVVEVSTNLAGWQTWLTNNSPPQPFTFTDTTVSTAPAKFYRVRLAP